VLGVTDRAQYLQKLDSDALRIGAHRYSVPADFGFD
jgi:hypothetical protein